MGEGFLGEDVHMVDQGLEDVEEVQVDFIGRVRFWAGHDEESVSDALKGLYIGWNARNALAQLDQVLKHKVLFLLLEQLHHPQTVLSKVLLFLLLLEFEGLESLLFLFETLQLLENFIHASCLQSIKY